jgi:preprotein translocase subunit SecG
MLVGGGVRCFRFSIRFTDSFQGAREVDVETLFMIVLSLVALFMILLVLVQRGRGGGLVGAFGGMGGQSAFGTKAGDLFTRITIVVAVFWIVLCIAAVWTFKPARDPYRGGVGPEPPAAGTTQDGTSESGQDEPLEQESPE